MKDQETYEALVRWHLRLGYSRDTAIRLALWCMDDSKAPGWTWPHMQLEGT